MSVAKRGSTSTSSGLTISGSAELWAVAAIPDLYPSNEGRSHDERSLRDVAKVTTTLVWQRTG
jgi:hypothetical protein